MCDVRGFEESQNDKLCFTLDQLRKFRLLDDFCFKMFWYICQCCMCCESDEFPMTIEQLMKFVEVDEIFIRIYIIYLDALDLMHYEGLEEEEIIFRPQIELLMQDSERS